MIQNLPKKSILNLFFCMPKQSMSLVKTSSVKRKLKNYYKKKYPRAPFGHVQAPSNATVGKGGGRPLVGSTPQHKSLLPTNSDIIEGPSVVSKIALARRSAIQVASLIRNEQQMDTNIIKYISKQQTATTCRASPASVRVKNKKLFLENIRFQKHYMPILSFFFTSFGPSTTSRRWQHFAAFTETDYFKKSDVNAVSILSPGPFKEALQSCTENVLGGNIKKSRATPALGSTKPVLSLGHEVDFNGIRTQALRPEVAAPPSVNATLNDLRARTIGVVGTVLRTSVRNTLVREHKGSGWLRASGTRVATWRRSGLRASLRANNLEYSFYGSFVNSRNYLKSCRTSASNPMFSKMVQLHVRWLLATYYICKRLALWPSAKLVALLQSGDSAHRRHEALRACGSRLDLLSAGLRNSPGSMVSMLSSHYVMQGLANSKMAEGGPKALNIPKLNGPVHASGCSLVNSTIVDGVNLLSPRPTGSLNDLQARTPFGLSRGELEREAITTYRHRAQDITPTRYRRLTPKAHLYHIETQLFKQLKGQLFNVHTMMGPIKKRSYTHIIPIKYSIYCYSAVFLADEIVQLLQQNRPFRQIWDQMIENINRLKHIQIKGIRISCAGRTSKKAAKAKTISAKYGRTSLHVFSAEIDFASKTANTRFGAIGVKVWLAWERSPRATVG